MMSEGASLPAVPRRSALRRLWDRLFSPDPTPIMGATHCPNCGHKLPRRAMM